MSTQSRIGIIELDGSIRSIYCHFDGDYEYNGKLLFENYQNIDKINKLINLGFISYLAENVEPEINQIHPFENPLSNTVVAYHRCDREEEKCVIDHSKSIRDFLNFSYDSMMKYIYLYDQKNIEWLTADYRTFKNEHFKKL